MAVYPDLIRKVWRACLLATTKMVPKFPDRSLREVWGYGEGEVNFDDAGSQQRRPRRLTPRVRAFNGI